MSARPLPSTVAHLDAMTATGAEGWLVISTPTPKGWRARSFTTDQVDEAAQLAADLDAAGQNVYVRASLIGRPLDNSRERGGAKDTAAAVAFVVDLDVAGPGHKPGPPDRLPLPPDMATALGIVAPLPPPSLNISTGGGAHLWWLLDEPETDNPVALLDAWADCIVEQGRRVGWHVDRPDPARVLRVCGTHRRKPGCEPNRVELVGVADWPADGLARRPWCPGGRYGARELLDALPAPAPPKAAQPSTSNRTRRPGEVGPADAVARLSWSQILAPLGWTYTGQGTMAGADVELWRRPGDPTSPYSAKCLPDGPAVAWSDACGLPTGRGQRLSKWRVFCALHHPNERPADVAQNLRRRQLEAQR